MKYTNQKLGIAGICLMLCALAAALGGVAAAQSVATTTVQGTVYLANGTPGSGTLQLNWPAFTTAANQAVAAGRTNVAIGSDGFVSVNLAPNVGATPAGLYYTAVYHLNDGTTSTEYWVVPAAAQAALGQVRATVMPSAQAVQAVNKAYVDQSIAQITQSQLTPAGGTLTGPLYLNGDPLTSPQAATKHYVDNQVGQTLSINGGAATGPLTATQLGAAYQADQFTGADFGSKLQACINALNATYGGSCDARNFSGTLAMASNVTISKANVTVNLPCATIATSSQIVVTAGTRNATLHGCASRGTTAASGNQGGTVFLSSGAAAMIQVGDSTYAADTLGFHLDNVVINTTSATAATAQAITVWRAQEITLEGLYLLGNANQTGITLDGTGNYTGGTLQDVEIGGFQTAVNAVGHQVTNAAITDWVNASTFVRLHIDCPTANGSAIAGTTGFNLAQGDGNTFTGGDVEGCATALHLGANAQNNTIVGLRNENSTYQVVAESGSAYNNWITGGTMFTGKLTDNGTRNSFLDTFHRSFNALNGDWFGSQQDATITNHYRLGIGSGNERGLLHRYQTDSGYRWTMGLSDASAGAQYYQVLDELNNVYRLSLGQYNPGQSSSNNQTVLNAAGTGAVILNGSNNAGSGGVVFGSGGASSATVATINSAGNAQFNGSLQVGGASTFLNSTTVKNQADAEIDAFLWAGATAPQKESVVYKDFNGNSQWYLVKDTSNNWAVNSAVGGVDSFKAYQSTNSGDTYIDAANNAGVVRVNYEPGSGSAFNVYGGGSGNLYASFNGTTGIKFPGLAAGSGHNCVQIDNTGYLSNTGAACSSANVGAGTTGQIAYYPGNGSTLAGVTAIPIGSGGTGATSASGALASLGGLPASGGTLSGPLSGTSASFSGSIAAGTTVVGSGQPINVLGFGAKCDGVTDDTVAVNAAITAAQAAGAAQVFFPAGTCVISGTGGSFTLPGDDGTVISGHGAPLSPEAAHTINYSVLVPSYTHLTGAGVGKTILTQNWIYGTSPIDLTQKIMFKLASGAGTVQIDNMSINNTFIPILGDGIIFGSNFQDLSLSHNGFTIILQEAERDQFRRLSLGQGAGIIVGGWWMSRNNQQNDSGGWADKNFFDQIEMFNAGTFGTTENNLDAFYDTYFFKTPNSAYAPLATITITSNVATATVVSGQRHNLALGSSVTISGATGNAACNGTFTIASLPYNATGEAQNQFTFAATGNGISCTGGTAVGANNRLSTAIDGTNNFGAWMPYRGVAGNAISILDRYWRPSFNDQFSNIRHMEAYRHPIYGGPEFQWDISNIYMEQVGFSDSLTFATPLIDPYQGTKINPVLSVFSNSNQSTLRGVYCANCAGIDLIGPNQYVRTFSSKTGVYQPGNASLTNVQPANSLSDVIYWDPATAKVSINNPSFAGAASGLTVRSNPATFGGTDLAVQSAGGAGGGHINRFLLQDNTGASHAILCTSDGGAAAQAQCEDNMVTLLAPRTGDGIKVNVNGTDNSGFRIASSGATTFYGAVTAPAVSVVSARRGTFTCTAGGTITIANSNYVSTSDVVITMRTAGGTITTPPAFKTVTSGTGFSVLCGAGDTSVYNYAILD